MAVVPYNPGSCLVQNIVTGTKTADVTSDAITGCDKYSALVLQAKFASTGGTSPTFNIYLQQLAPDGSTWYDIASMTQITANGNYILAVVSAGSSNFTATTGTLTAGTILSVPFGGNMRVFIDVGGTNPTAAITVGIEFIE